MIQTLRSFDYGHEQIGLLLNSKPGTFGANFVGPIVFFLMYSTLIPFVYIFAWLLLQLTVFLIRIKVRDRGLKAIEVSNENNVRKYLIYYLGTIFANSLLWGSAAILVLHFCSETFFFLYIIILVGLGAAGSSSIGIVFHAIAIFLTNTLGFALILILYYASTLVDYLLACLVFFYFIYMLKVSFTNYSFIMTNIQQRDEIAKSHSLIKESIEYAALIQKAMLPKEQTLERYFEDSFLCLKQKDIVGGDFYSVIPLNDNEFLVMVLDGVGHGVSGAFMTMLIKATEQQIVTEIHHQALEAKPNLILARFNALMKTMIEDHGDVKASIGFDGGILYVNQTTAKASYAGAKMPLFVMNNHILESYKGDRKSIGFTRTPMEQEFTQYEIDVSSEMKFYFATDGVFDQEGEHDSRFGQKRFERFLETHHEKAFQEQYEIFKAEREIFSQTKGQLDDATVLGFSLKVSH
ncbi:MAG TPA: hypothetical protein ENK82_06160 [Campylobacterales bacterium]|nr:hypothetical protein [Campylobacterales bacterium]